VFSGQQQLHREFDRITDVCLKNWRPPQSQAGKDGLVPVRVGLALGIASAGGVSRVEHVSIERVNFSDSDLERCLVEQSRGSDVTLPKDYQEPGGGLRSLPPLPDGNFRLWYPVALGVPAHWNAKNPRAGQGP
jgi:hypothetical protein